MTFTYRETVHGANTFIEIFLLEWAGSNTLHTEALIGLSAANRWRLATVGAAPTAKLAALVVSLIGNTSASKRFFVTVTAALTHEAASLAFRLAAANGIVKVTSRVGAAHSAAKKGSHG